MYKSNKKRGIGWTALATVLICLSVGVIGADEGDEKISPDQEVKVIVTTADGAAAEVVDVTLGAEEVKPGKYWIGVMCQPLDNELLRTHLNVKQALVVTEVVADSPAQEAGLLADDILIKVGDKSLSDLNVLVASIEEAQEGKIQLTIVRKGKRKEVELTPVKRPDKFSIRRVEPDREAVAEWRMLQDALRKQGAMPKQESDDPDDSDLSLMLVMPGFVIPNQATDLPSNLEVTITKKGQEAARIIVKRGDEKWETDAKSLDKLPKDIRPQIEKMLGHKMSIRLGAGNLDWFGALPKGLAAPRILRRSLQIAPGKVYELHQFEHKLHDEMREKIQQQLKQAQRAVESAKTQIPTDALENIENELKTLREQLEQLRREQTDKEQDKENEDE